MRKRSVLILDITPANKIKKLRIVRIEKVISQDVSSLMIAIIPVRKMTMVRIPPPVITMGTIRKSIAITSNM